MIVGLTFWILTLASCAYAWWRGGTDGRLAAIMIMAASVLSYPAGEIGARYHRTEDAILVVDLALLVGLYTLSRRSRRFFLLWMTGFHMVAVMSHFSTFLLPDIAANIYRALSSFWAVPIALVMFFGIRADRKAHLFMDDGDVAPEIHREEAHSI